MPVPDERATAVDAALERVSRADCGRLVATLIRLTGDFDLAEDALSDALAQAVEQWPSAGVPQHPDAWVLTAARRRALDRQRRSATFEEKVAALALESPAEVSPFDDMDSDSAFRADDQLRLIFTCCHPALVADAQVALTLRTVCGLTTDEIARAFLTTGPTIAQRIVRAKQKIREARIPYRVPEAIEIPERLSAVLMCIYLVFTEGYAASAGDVLVRRELCREAIRLARLVRELMPEQSEVSALLALLLLHDSRRDARSNTDDDVVLLDEQDRTKWDRAQIDEGRALVELALRGGTVGPYALQAAIAALHAEPARAEETDWPQILALYDLLRRVAPSPVVELNRAVAVLKVRGAIEALAIVDEIADSGALESYHLLPATRAHLLRELGRYAEAAHSYREAVSLAGVEQERRFLRRRLAECEAAASEC